MPDPSDSVELRMVTCAECGEEFQIGHHKYMLCPSCAEFKEHVGVAWA
jgi:Zn finger protein HypA/HybF involved in hydrogenase expression